MFKRKAVIPLIALLIAMPSYADNYGVDVIGGKEVNQSDWPAFVNGKFQGNCSATIIGKRTIITAAHCISDANGSGTVSIKNKEFEIECSRHPLYPDIDHDMALCIAKADFGAVPESVSMTRYPVGEEAHLFGYGCTTANGGGSSDGKLRTGTAKIESWTGREAILKGAAACFGDSGGPALIETAGDFLPSRKVLGVMSKGNMKDKTWVTWLGNKENKKFIDSWAKKNNAKICGIHLKGKGCAVGGGPSEGKNNLPKECKELLANNALLLRVLNKCLVSEVAPKEKVCDATYAVASDCFNERF